MENKPDTIQWVEKITRLSDLRPFEHNPRTITEAQYAKLKRSLSDGGYRTRIESTHDGRVIAGHQRLKVLRDLGYTDIPVLVPDRPLTDAQFKAALITSNVNNGTWDVDMLANMFDLEELRDFGLHEVMNIAPLDNEDEAPPKAMVCCPSCGTVFPTKGNKAK